MRRQWIEMIVPASRRSRRNAMVTEINPGLALLGGLGLGAGLMYLFDPARGRRRRALMRDRMTHTVRVLARAMPAMSRDIKQRAYGMLAEGGHLFQHEDVPNEILEARVRAKIGRSVSHPHAITATVDDGVVTLRGQILDHELNHMLAGVSAVRGVREVENLLMVHSEEEDIACLQGGRPRTGDRFALLQDNWSPTARLLTGVTGGALMANCLARRDPMSVALGTIGFGLLMRGATNIDLKSLIGVGHDCRAFEVQKTININAPVERVFEFWNNYQNFPHFMSRVRQVILEGGGRSRWTFAGPAGIPVEWTAEITELVPNKLLAWRSIPGAAIDHSGTIHFEAKAEGGTRVHIRLSYHPIGGALGHILARMAGSDPKSEMDADLVRMKTYIETGHAPHDAASPRIDEPAARPADVNWVAVKKDGHSRTA
ncbi:MAG: SRPBCC family protein [Blastocatellia bacterium]|nr:SRPBCC family protein [Blastocatellia bacterium]